MFLASGLVPISSSHRYEALAAVADAPALWGIPLEFLLFGATLVGIALFHRHTLKIAVVGLAVVTAYKMLFTGFPSGSGVQGLAAHIQHEWVILANLFCLLMGFALLARHFEKSEIPVVLPRYLPRDWKGAFLVLAMVFALSAFLDNIAAAMIGGAMSHSLFRAKVHIGFLAAIVAAANAGGAGSVLGDTTTTMMWIGGVSPFWVLNAYVGAGVALLIFGIPAAIVQQRHSPILTRAHQHTRVDWRRIGIVATMLVAALGVNLMVNVRFPSHADQFPFIGVALWVAVMLTAGVRRHDWEVLPRTFAGALFLLSLVLIASMMPVERLPAASWPSTFALGFLSAAFDNIPLTALALKQGGYDWGMLAFAVGFGGSMLWFGSSAGVAIANMYPEGRSVGGWLRNGWFVPVAYVAGFGAILLLLGWHGQ